MATEAYILIETSVGRVRDAARELESLPGIESVEPVTGPYDVIAVVNAPDLNAVGDLVTSRIHGIAGIIRTITCLSVGAG